MTDSALERMEQHLKRGFPVEGATPMPWLENHRDWPRAMDGWDTGRRARHAAHAARYVAAGWAADAASILAFDLVMEEEEAGEARGSDGAPAPGTG